MKGMTEFRRAMDTLSPYEREAAVLRCAGMTAAQIAARRSVTVNTIKNQVNRAINKMRAVPEMRNMAAQGVIEAVCYRLGYEQALSDIEMQLRRRQAA